MLGVFVRFRYSADFDANKVRAVASSVRAKFEGLAGLRSKAFTINAGQREATNFYVWDSPEAGRAFFNEELLARVTTLYGVRPSVEFVEIAELVQNG